MDIIESFIYSKTGDMADCEDGLFIGEDYIAVIDGVSAKGKRRWNGGTGGFYAKEIIIGALAGLKGDEDAQAALAYINSELRAQYGDEIGFFTDKPEERIQACLIIYSKSCSEVWSFGDCAAIIGGATYQAQMKIDELVSEIRALYLHMEILRGKSLGELVADDPSYEAIFPLLKGQILLANSGHEYGYSVLDGFCGDFSSVKVYGVRPGDTVILASDGYPKLFDTLAESEAYLARLKENDPLCIREIKLDKGFTNGKASLDDRTYVKFKA